MAAAGKQSGVTATYRKAGIPNGRSCLSSDGKASLSRLLTLDVHSCGLGGSVWGQALVWSAASLWLRCGMLHSKLPVAWWVWGRPAHLSYVLRHHGCSTGLRGRNQDWPGLSWLETDCTQRDVHLTFFFFFAYNKCIQYCPGMLFLAGWKSPCDTTGWHSNPG